MELICGAANIMLAFYVHSNSFQAEVVLGSSGVFAGFVCAGYSKDSASIVERGVDF
jgi:hypothetical protein